MEVVLREDSSEEIQNEAARETDLPPWELQETQWSTELRHTFPR